MLTVPDQCIASRYVTAESAIYEYVESTGAGWIAASDDDLNEVAEDVRESLEALAEPGESIPYDEVRQQLGL